MGVAATDEERQEGSGIERSGQERRGGETQDRNGI